VGIEFVAGSVVGVRRRGVTVGLVVGVGKGVGSFIEIRVSVGVGGTGVAVDSMVTARTTGSEGELLARTAWIFNWVLKSI
jgi:hypothetical protein